VLLAVSLLSEQSPQIQTWDGETVIVEGEEGWPTLVTPEWILACLRVRKRVDERGFIPPEDDNDQEEGKQGEEEEEAEEVVGWGQVEETLTESEWDTKLAGLKMMEKSTTMEGCVVVVDEEVSSRMAYFKFRSVLLNDTHEPNLTCMGVMVLS